MTTDILGQGFAFPIRVDARGRIALSAGSQKVREAILTLIGTQHGERLMRPDYGANLRSLVFAPNSPASADLARFLVEDALARFEPRVAVETVDVEVGNDGGRLLIRLGYRIVATQQPDTVVIPLPLTQE